MTKSFVPILAAGGVVAVAALGTLAQGQHADMAAGEVTRAVAVLHPTSKSQVHGTVTFTKVVGGVRVVGHVSGLTPGKHGFHIHEFGDCTDPAGKSAGGHFNPKGAPHAGPGMKSHVGDLGNIEADAKGEAAYDKVISQVMFHGESSILGRAVIVHEKEDDLKTQGNTPGTTPGNSGARLACGVIGVAKSETPKK